MFAKNSSLALKTINLFFCLAVFLFAGSIQAREPDQVIDIWPNLAPGEQTKNAGVTLPRRLKENPPSTRIKEITQPRLHLYLPPEEKQNGSAVLIFPGGGYNYVVIDKEGSEVAERFNSIGVTTFVVHYRTKRKQPLPQGNPILPPFSERPLQDGQRAISLIRHRASQWNLNPKRIGVLGLSAGGQIAGLLSARFNEKSYKSQDKIDAISCKPDFTLMIYPWRLIDTKTNQLSSAFTFSDQLPPLFLVHAHNDSNSSLNSILFYSSAKKQGIEAELHIYQTGGHGNGLRHVKNSSYSTWPDRAENWLRNQKLLDK
jgi:acetyl esterase/lipase